MVNFSNEQILEFFKYMGVQEKDCVKNNEILDIYKLLKIEPRLKADGSREITPYEILRVPPVFDNGKEKPIVFAIKNKAKKIGKYEGSETTFFYMSKKVKEEKSLIDTLKSNYRRAIFLGDLEGAKNYLSMISDISDEDAKELLSSFYDYTKIYRSMKKQLIIDLFAHFFLIYMRNAMRAIKKGLVRANKLYKPFKQEQEEQDEENENAPFVPDVAVDPLAYGIGNIEKVTIHGEDEQSLSFDFKNKGSQNLEKVETEKPEKMARFSLPKTKPQDENGIEKPEEMPKVEQSETNQMQSTQIMPNFFGESGRSLIKKRKNIFAKHFGFLDKFDNEDEQLLDEKINQIVASKEKTGKKYIEQTDETAKKYE